MLKLSTKLVNIFSNKNISLVYTFISTMSSITILIVMLSYLLNLFFTDDDPKKAADWILVSSHICKMPLETTQAVYDAARLVLSKDVFDNLVTTAPEVTNKKGVTRRGYAVSHKGHPLTTWIALSHANMLYALLYVLHASVNYIKVYNTRELIKLDARKRPPKVPRVPQKWMKVTDHALWLLAQVYPKVKDQCKYKKCSKTTKPLFLCKDWVHDRPLNQRSRRYLIDCNRQLVKSKHADFSTRLKSFKRYRKPHPTKHIGTSHPKYTLLTKAIARYSPLLQTQ